MKHFKYVCKKGTSRAVWDSWHTRTDLHLFLSHSFVFFTGNHLDFETEKISFMIEQKQDSLYPAGSYCFRCHLICPGLTKRHTFLCSWRNKSNDNLVKQISVHDHGGLLIVKQSYILDIMNMSCSIQHLDNIKIVLMRHVEWQELL